MKTLPDEIKRKLSKHNSLIVYVKANVKFKDNTTITLNPDNFKISDNSYTQSGGDGFPIGLAICKTITINIDNTNEQFNDYDWYNAEISLYSRLYFTDYTNPSNDSYYDMFEGIFYVSDIQDNLQYITLNAADFMLKLELPTRIFNAVGTQYQRMFLTIGDYFRYIGQEISQELYNTMDVPVFSSNVFDYDTDTALFTNSEKSMSYINDERAAKNDNITYRDLLGYMAQLACGNLVITYEDNEPRIDILEYNFSSFLDDAYTYEIISGGRFRNTIEDTINCGTFGDGLSDTIDCGTFSDANYILLDKFSTSPRVEFSVVYYTGLKLDFPVVGQEIYSYRRLPTPQKSSNELNLLNPILTHNEHTPEATQHWHDIEAIAQVIYTRLCNRKIRPFSGTYLTYPIAEFMDNVIVMNRNGDLYKSFITEHIYNYLQSSEIKNSVPTVARNNQVYYNNLE